MRGKKRGRGRRSTLRGDSTVQQYPYSPPPPPPLPPPPGHETRHSKPLLGHIPNLSTPLRNPIRSILKISSHSTPLEFENAVDDVKPSLSDGSPSRSGTILSLGIELTSQEAQEAIDLQPSLDRCLLCKYPAEDSSMSRNGSPCCSEHNVSKHMQDPVNEEPKQVIDPQKKNDTVLVPLEDRPGKSCNTNFSNRSSRCLSSANSFNITAFAQRVQEDMEEDPDEVESALDPAYVTWEEYNVKSEYAPLLGEIFHKFGDIARGTDIKSPVVRSLLLQHVCDIYKRLKEAKLCGIPLRRLEEMRGEVKDLENMKVDVGWLRKKLDDIIQAHIEFGSYLNVKKDEKANVEALGREEEALKAYEDQLSLIQQKICATKEGILEKKAKDDQLKRVALGIKAKVTPLLKNGLLS